jgi:hypothetical protein
MLLDWTSTLCYATCLLDLVFKEPNFLTLRLGRYEKTRKIHSYVHYFCSHFMYAERISLEPNLTIPAAICLYPSGGGH